jgi:hypothetical protein
MIKLSGSHPELSGRGRAHAPAIGAPDKRRDRQSRIYRPSSVLEARSSSWVQRHDSTPVAAVAPRRVFLLKPSPRSPAASAGEQIITGHAKGRASSPGVKLRTARVFRATPPNSEQWLVLGIADRWQTRLMPRRTRQPVPIRGLPLAVACARSFPTAARRPRRARPPVPAPSPSPIRSQGNSGIPECELPTGRAMMASIGMTS